jgi:hypothetical protein
MAGDDWKHRHLEIAVFDDSIGMGTREACASFVDSYTHTAMEHTLAVCSYCLYANCLYTCDCRRPSGSCMAYLERDTLIFSCGSRLLSERETNVAGISGVRSNIVSGTWPSIHWGLSESYNVIRDVHCLHLRHSTIWSFRAVRNLLVVTALAGAPFLSAVHAEDLDAARACTHLRDAAARLTCYDAAFGVEKMQDTQPVGVEPAHAQARFGDNDQVRSKTKTDLPKKLTLAVQQVTALPEGHYRLTLDNGQVWQTTQADWTMDFKASDLVIISRMPLGGYQISSTRSGHSSVGAKRIR